MIKMKFEKGVGLAYIGQEVSAMGNILGAMAVNPVGDFRQTSKFENGLELL